MNKKCGYFIKSLKLITSEKECRDEIHRVSSNRFQRKLKNIDERKQAAINPVASANNAATKA